MVIFSADEIGLILAERAGFVGHVSLNWIVERVPEGFRLVECRLEEHGPVRSPSEDGNAPSGST